MTRIATAVAAIALTMAFAGGAPVSAQIIPGVPTNLRATQNGGNLTVAWNAPTTGAAPTGYRLEFFAGTTSVVTLPVGNVTSVDIPIPPGTQGTFSVTVTAVSTGFSGTPSFPVVFTLGGGCAPPAAPTGLTGSFVNGDVRVQWNGVAGATGYLVQAGSVESASDLFNAPVGNITSVGASGLPPTFRAFLRVRSQNACGVSAPTPDFFLGATPPPQPTVCIPSPARACAFNRFQIDVSFRDNAGRSGAATIAPNGRYNDGAQYYFFDPTQIDLLVQVLDRCERSDRYWVFVAGETSAELDIRVTDTASGTTRLYSNPLNRRFPGVTDTSAFATCP